MSKAGRALSPADRIDFGCLIFAALSQGVAVCKLDAERRQTPTRNLNDESEVRAAARIRKRRLSKQSARRSTSCDLRPPSVRN
jgi:hypothetical protein